METELEKDPDSSRSPEKWPESKSELEAEENLPSEGPASLNLSLVAASHFSRGRMKSLWNLSISASTLYFWAFWASTFVE